MSIELLTVKDVAKMVKRSPDHIYRCVREGTIPHYKMGRDVRFSLAQVEQWLAEKRVYTKVELKTIAEARNIN